MSSKRFVMCLGAAAVIALGAGACKKKGDKAGEGGGSATSGGSAASGGSAGTGAATPTAGVKVTQLVAGVADACAMVEGGEVRCWGMSDHGELGTGRVEGQAATATPIAGAKGKQLVFGGDSGSSGDVGCTVTDGKAWCWGGVNMMPDPAPDTKGGEATALAGVTQLALSSGMGFFLTNDGTVKGWGGNTFNAMGLGASTDVPRDKVETIPVSGVVAVDAGQNHGCVLHEDSTVSCWGYLGSDKLDPTKVEGVTDAATLVTGWSDNCVITKAKKVQCWRDVKGAKEVDGLDDVVALDGLGHWCAVKGDGTVWCWGSNNLGQLGQGTTGSSTSKPGQVVELTDATAVAVGGQFSCALEKDGTVWCWGSNRYGQLGDGTLVDRSKPVQVKGVNDKTAPAPADGLAEVQEPTTVQSWDGLPEGCVHDAQLDLEFKDFEGKFDVKSSYASDTGDQGVTYKVELANINRDPGQYVPLRGKQLMLSVRFGKVDLEGDKKPMPVDVGVYSMDHEQERLVYPAFADRAFDNYMMSDISLEGMKAGEAEITHLDADWICGELRLQTKSSKALGKFAARIVHK
ncbi:MAG: hypothetical protein H6709_20945 [Kofleriaceae bacterium]|nr:hypothetical protein [Myxococcales bacterium]MCB9562618.1 hypothetical protein [Kofleriaceae bacterium]MCB9574551.1 hypothetical protein [Kofleriaceae bacterium]